MASATGSQAGVKSALRTLDLIEFVVARPSGVVAQEIANALDIPMSSLSYLLATLVERGYLRREGRQYVPGEGLDRLRAPSAGLSLIDRARPLLKALRSQLNETATLFRLVGWEAEAVLTETAGQPLRYSIDVGARAPLHAVAAGKIFLSMMSDEQLDRYFAEVSLNGYTEHTIRKRAQLMKALETVRKTGIASARNEFTQGITAFGTALHSGADAPMAVSVASPSTRMTPELEARIAAALGQAAQALKPGCIAG